MGLLSIVLVAIISYLAGSFPTSLVAGRLLFGTDIRTKGSGNAGGTNSFRVYGWKVGVLVVVVDVGKGALAALLVSRLGAPSGLPPLALGLIAGAFAVIGHVWTAFAGFRGGKGVATAAGALVALSPLGIGFSALIFAITLFSTGIVSLASMAAALAFPAALLALGALGHPASPWLIGVSAFLAPLILLTHRANISRLLAGTENRFDHLVLWRILRRAAMRSTKGAAKAEARLPEKESPASEKAGTSSSST